MRIADYLLCHIRDKGEPHRASHTDITYKTTILRFYIYDTTFAAQHYLKTPKKSQTVNNKKNTSFPIFFILFIQCMMHIVFLCYNRTTTKGHKKRG